MKVRIQRALFLLGGLATFVQAMPVYASGNGSGINNPLAGQQGSVASILNTVIAWVLGAISSVAAAWLLFHLYKAVMGFMAGSHHAQRREEAKAHLVHVGIAGVMLGAAGVIAGALYHFGAGLH